MRYVLDCSVALQWFLPEDSSDVARALLLRVRSGEDAFVAPEVILPEFAHSLRKHVVGRRVARDEAIQIWREFRAVPIELVPNAALLDDALQLALDHMGTLYDALYIALAQHEDLKVLTGDERMFKAFGRLGRTLTLATLG